MCMVHTVVIASWSTVVHVVVVLVVFFGLVPETFYVCNSPTKHDN